MKTKWKVMIEIPAGYDDCISGEYTGIAYDTREEARREFMQAKEDVNVECAWIEGVEA